MQEDYSILFEKTNNNYSEVLIKPEDELYIAHKNTEFFDTFIAYIFLGKFGIHRFCHKHYDMGILILISTIVGFFIPIISIISSIVLFIDFIMLYNGEVKNVDGEPIYYTGNKISFITKYFIVMIIIKILIVSSILNLIGLLWL